MVLIYLLLQLAEDRGHCLRRAENGGSLNIFRRCLFALHLLLGPSLLMKVGSFVGNSSAFIFFIGMVSATIFMFPLWVLCTRGFSELSTLMRGVGYGLAWYAGYAAALLTQQIGGTFNVRIVLYHSLSTLAMLVLVSLACWPVFKVFRLSFTPNLGMEDNRFTVAQLFVAISFAAVSLGLLRIVDAPGSLDPKALFTSLCQVLALSIQCLAASRGRAWLMSASVILWCMLMSEEYFVYGAWALMRSVNLGIVTFGYLTFELSRLCGRRVYSILTIEKPPQIPASL